MSKTQGSRDLSDTMLDVLTGAAKFLMGVGALATLISVAFLITICFKVAGDSTLGSAAMQNISLFQRVLIPGCTGLAVGAIYMFWGEDIAGAILVMLAAALYFAPLYVPMVLPNNASNSAIGEALGAIQQGGMALGVISICSVVFQVAVRVKQRVKVGVKADQLKFGKGIKEEADRQNVFMGNCWQLPYCRKFVRERCPIFHSKRTCWREKVGCMCEEEVIRNAMENKLIPKDALLASKMIPKNFKLNETQKIARCKTCVIYNEHQRHKYRLFLPLMIVGFIAFYGVLHGPLVASTYSMANRINAALHAATLSGASKTAETPVVFVEGLLFVLMLVALTYCLKALEFLIFKLKI